MAQSARQDSHTRNPIKALFVETFQSETPLASTGWVSSDDVKYSGRFGVEQVPTKFGPTFPGDNTLSAAESHRFYGISHKLPQPIDVNEGKHFVLQYEFRPTNMWECAGGYMKLFSDADFDPAKFGEHDKYSIMFGPDRCGADGKVHFIIQRKDPKTGELVEHHLVDPPVPPADMTTHLYQLVINLESQTFDIFIDMVNQRNGSLASSLEPPLEPPKEINDPDDVQPDEWVTQEQIPDPNAVKPSDWDESQPEFVEDPKAERPENWNEAAEEYINDPEAQRPSDWDDEEDGAWMQPRIPNPACASAGCGPWIRPRIRNPLFQGPWRRPLVANPVFKGLWKPRRIPNPDWYANTRPTADIAPLTAIGFDLWTVVAGISIDNIVIGRSKRALDAFALATAMPKAKGELESLMKSYKGAEKPPQSLFQQWKFIGLTIFVVLIVAFVVIRKCFCGSSSVEKTKKE